MKRLLAACFLLVGCGRDTALFVRQVHPQRDASETFIGYFANAEACHYARVELDRWLHVRAPMSTYTSVCEQGKSIDRLLGR